MMTTALSEFDDIAERTLFVPETYRHREIAFTATRGLDSYTTRLLQHGLFTLGDIHGKKVADLISERDLRTTRKNFDEFLQYLRWAGAEIV